MTIELKAILEEQLTSIQSKLNECSDYQHAISGVQHLDYGEELFEIEGEIKNLTGQRQEHETTISEFQLIDASDVDEVIQNGFDAIQRAESTLDNVTPPPNDESEDDDKEDEAWH